MTAKVVVNLASQYENVSREVGGIMVGKTLDYEAKRILNEGIKQGLEQGLKQGVEQGLELGSSRAFTLLRKLKADQRNDLANSLINGEITAEHLYRLYMEYGIL